MLERRQVTYTNRLNYRPHPGSGAMAPYVVVTLGGPGGESIDTLALVDSGAAFSLFDGQLAAPLGFELGEGRPVDYSLLSGDRLRAYMHRAYVEVDGLGYWSEVAFSEQQIPRNLLGRADFFLRHRIGFSEHFQEILLAREQGNALRP